MQHVTDIAQAMKSHFSRKVLAMSSRNDFVPRAYDHPAGHFCPFEARPDREDLCADGEKGLSHVGLGLRLHLLAFRHRLRQVRR